MIFKNVTFYNEVFQKDVADIQVENGRITAIGVLEQEGRHMQGYTLLPGFVDIHIHGRGGRWFFRRHGQQYGSNQRLPG